MKVKFYALLGILSFASVSLTYAQANLRGAATQASTQDFKGFQKQVKTENQLKTMNCVDTLRYSELKEFGLADGVAYRVNMDSQWDERAMQVFDAGASTHAVTGIEFFGRGKTIGGATTIEASVVALDANFQPTSTYATATISTAIADTAYQYRIVNFNTPANVTGLYGIVLRTTNSGSKLTIFTSDVDDPYNLYEGESLIYDDGYGYDFVPSYTDLYYGEMLFFDFMMSPIVSYPLNSSFTINPTPICLNTPITFTANSQPSDLLTSKYYNIDAFVDYWFSVGIDSLYVFNLDNNFQTGVASNTATKTYTTAGNHLVELYTFTGFSRLCMDKKDTLITVFDTPVAPTAISGNATVCEGVTETYSVPAVAGAVDYTWTLPSGWSGTSTTNSITVTTGAVGGTISVVANSPCGSSSSTSLAVTVNNNPTATFTYANPYYCISSANELPVMGPNATIGTFSVSPAGLDINPATGEINFANSVAGLYTITNTIASVGACNGTLFMFSINVLDGPAVTVTADEDNFCVNANATLTASGADTYTWSPAADLSSTSGSTVVATLSATTTYTVTGTDANNCSSTAQITINVNPNPTVTLDAFSNVCEYTPEFALTGGLPAGGSYSGTAVNNDNFNPATAGIGTFAISYNYTDANGCSATATENIEVTDCLGLDNTANNYNFEVFPVPANEVLNLVFSMEQGQNLEVKLYSMDAKVVYSTNIVSNNVNQVVIPVSNLASGVYYLNVSNANHNFGQKVIIK